MSVAAIETRRSILLTGWCLLAVIVLALVIAVGVSVGELAIPLQNVFYAISNRTGLTAEPLNRIYESVIWDFRLSRALVAACCSSPLRARNSAMFACSWLNTLTTFCPWIISSTKPLSRPRQRCCCPK